MFRARPLLSAVLCAIAGTASADPVETCAAAKEPWARLTACSEVIASGDWEGSRAGWAHSNRAMAHAELGNHLDAFDDHNQAIKLDPSNPRAWNNRATSHAKFREFDRAFRDYDKALELDPSYVNALINRASLSFETGRAAEARENYTAAIALEEKAGRDTAGLQFLLADAACALGDVAEATARRTPAFDAGLFTRDRMAETLIATGYLVRSQAKDRTAFDLALTRWTEAGCVWDG